MDIHQFEDWLIDQSYTLIQGILNITPDSFSDGGRFIEPEKAFLRAIKMIEEGVDIIDVGGESTRPGSDPISVDEELGRIIPTIERIKKESDCLISVDTYKSNVASEAINSGASIVNDISGLTYDNKMASLIIEKNIPLILMHMKGKPKTMQEEPFYKDVISEICNFFKMQINQLRKLNVSFDKIILDPGIGFGKTLDHNLLILNNLNIIRKLGYPVAIGTSRKSFIGEILGLPTNDRIEGSISSNIVAIINGANIIRVHDIAEMKKAVFVLDRILKV